MNASSVVERSALVERDDQIAKEVLWKEAQINQKDIEIDEFATRLLALYQPMARDMRFLTAAIKINGDLERMGDLAVNITERALSLMRENPVKPLIDIPRMADLAEAMVRKSLDALVNRDEQLARLERTRIGRHTRIAAVGTDQFAAAGLRECRKCAVHAAPPASAPSAACTTR